MAETREVLNTHQQLTLAGGGVAITLAYNGVRDQSVYGWAIYRVDAKGKQIVTNPDAAWYEYGEKVFRGKGASFHERQRDALEAAKKWVAEQGWYDGEWKRNRMRDYVPAGVDKRFPIRRSN